MHKSICYRSLLLTALVGVSLTACDPVPREGLTSDAKKEDMNWIYAMFEKNYAPMELKQKLYGFNYDDLKVKYLEEAANTKTNSEFYQVMMKFVAEFHDAHTSGDLTASDLPGRASVAFLGFTGKRIGDHLVVTGLMPTYDEPSSYPINIEDEIYAIDGIKLPDAIKAGIIKNRNLGSDEANLTFHMNRLFTRSSLQEGIPEADYAVLTVKSVFGGDSKGMREVRLPWVVQDMVTFQEQIAEAKAARRSFPGGGGNGGNGGGGEDENTSTAPIGSLQEFFTFTGAAFNDVANAASGVGQSLQFGWVGFDGLLKAPMKLAKLLHRSNNPLFNYLNTFVFADNVSSWTKIKAPKVDKAGNPVAFREPSMVDYLRAGRNVPENATFLALEGDDPNLSVFPMYIYEAAVRDSMGYPIAGKTKNVGVMWVPTFAPDASDDQILYQVRRGLALLKTFGVKDLIIDTLNNGGGSLMLSLRLASAFSATPLKLPSMQFKISDSWMDEFEHEMRSGSNPTSRELARRVYGVLSDQKAQGLKLSTPQSIEELAPYTVYANKKVDPGLRVVLLVNEMCASACDIFASIMQDNKKALLIGSRTMGAGGNVVDYDQAPNSYFSVRQTESLMVRVDGSYIENNGIKPEVELPQDRIAKSKYDYPYYVANMISTTQKSAVAPATKGDPTKDIPPAQLGQKPSGKQPLFDVSSDVLDSDVQSAVEAADRQYPASSQFASQ